MKVVKLGGSLLETGKIFDCLKHLVKVNEKTVVVCGGGVFANYVRDAQQQWGFDDIAAHEMAILAMQQTAIMCQNMQPEFTLVSKRVDLKNHQLAIWSPDINELNAAKIKPSWNVTSDSLAAWLAVKLNAEKLMIVKSCEVDSRCSVKELQKHGVIDSMFENFIKNSDVEIEIISATTFLT